MKAYFNLIILILISCSAPKSVNIQNPNLNIHNLQEFAFGTYTVTRIDSINNIYLIYAKKDSLLFKIASVKESVENCSYIKINGKYGLRLHSLFAKQIAGHEIMPSCLVTSVDYNGTTLSKEIGCVDDLFFADNVKGLCIH
jgi:hypothetical protein